MTATAVSIIQFSAPGTYTAGASSLMNEYESGLFYTRTASQLAAMPLRNLSDEYNPLMRAVFSEYRSARCRTVNTCCS